MAGFGG
jgi:hypothetical protein